MTHVALEHWRDHGVILPGEQARIAAFLAAPHRDGGER